MMRASASFQAPSVSSLVYPNPEIIRPLDAGDAQMDYSYPRSNKMYKHIVGVILVAGVGVTSLSARQGQSVPGLGSGVVTVKGVVGITNTVPVTQSGAWRVGVDGTANVRIENEPIVWIAPPSFIKARGRYGITWNSGETENVTISGMAGAGWVEVTTNNGSTRWVNLTLARAIEAAR
jgi:hypothetical protein